MKKPLIINFFGAPGAGKSTGATYVFSQLKLAGINAEYVSEFAKDKVWEHNTKIFNSENQIYLLGKQTWKVNRLLDDVDVIITDSPILLSTCYVDDEDSEFNDLYYNLVLKIFKKYNNFNIFINRDKPYNPAGRNQTIQEADTISLQIQSLLNSEKIPYIDIKGNIEGYDNIVKIILNHLQEAAHNDTNGTEV